MLRTRLVAAATVIAALSASTLTLGTEAALAGILTVHANPSVGTGCDLFTPNGGLNQFYYGCDGVAGSNVGFGYFSGGAALPAGSRIGYQINAPAGIAIYATNVGLNNISNINDNEGWGGGGYWSGGGDSWSSGSSSETDGPFNSSYWGFQMVCGWSSCSNSGAISVNTVEVVAVENQGPSLTAEGSNNLWYQTGRYVWNPAGDPWPITLAANDPSGVCNMYASVNNVTVPGPSATPNTSEWQQCPDPTWTPAAGATVDTRDYVSGAGPLSLALGASNAAGVSSQPSETLQVDNDPVNVSLATPDDPNPSVWVNHVVTVDAKASAGPSGIGGMNCSVDHGKAATYPAGGVAVDSSGVHMASCTAWNTALDPQGNPNTGTASEQIKIDETPPAVSFEPQNPGDPTALVVNTTDSESGVAGGTVTMSGPGLNSPVALATSTDGSHLLARFDDAGLRGAYTFTATSCDNVGNCASTSQAVDLPVRLHAISDVSFAKIQTPAKIVRKRVLVDYHYKVEHRRQHKRVRVKVGGHYRRIRIVIPANTSCAHRRVKVATHHWREITACRVLKLKLRTKRRVGFGRKVTVHGLLLTAQGAPMAGVPVSLQTAPDGTRRFKTVGVVTTDLTGGWSAKLRAGPSRIIHAVYGGSGSLLPATGQATVTVPAKIRITSIKPRAVPWGAKIKITGKLFGGYLPSGGALIELHYGYGRAWTVYGVKPHVTKKRFTTTFTFGPGQTPLTFRFKVSTLPAGDYPYAPGSSNTTDVAVGGG
jgi:hypothetical protein